LCSESPQAGQSGVLTLVGGEIFRTHPNWSRDPPSFLYNEYSISFIGFKQPGHGADHPPLLTSSLSMDGSIPVPTIFACLACDGKEFAFDVVQIVLALRIEACGVCNC